MLPRTPATSPTTQWEPVKSLPVQKKLLPPPSPKLSLVVSSLRFSRPTLPPVSASLAVSNVRPAAHDVQELCNAFKGAAVRTCSCVVPLNVGTVDWILGKPATRFGHPLLQQTAVSTQICHFALLFANACNPLRTTIGTGSTTRTLRSWGEIIPSAPAPDSANQGQQIVFPHRTRILLLLIR